MGKVSLVSSYIPKKFLNTVLDPVSLDSAEESSDDDGGNVTMPYVPLFVIDNKPDAEEQLIVTTTAEEDKEEATKVKPDQANHNTDTRKKSQSMVLASEIQPGFDTTDSYIKGREAKEGRLTFQVPNLSSPALDAVLSKSAIGPGYEKQYTVPEYSESNRQRKRHRLAEREKTRGSGWFDMPAQELTEELKNDLEILQMRRALDRKHFYKKNDPLPKYFQVGTVLDSPADYYHSRVPKKERKRTLVEELLADAEFKKYGKKKYNDIVTKNPKLRNRYKKRKN